MNLATLLLHHPDHWHLHRAAKNYGARAHPVLCQSLDVNHTEIPYGGGTTIGCACGSTVRLEAGVWAKFIEDHTPPSPEPTILDDLTALVKKWTDEP